MLNTYGFWTLPALIHLQ